MSDLLDRDRFYRGRDSTRLYAVSNVRRFHQDVYQITQIQNTFIGIPSPREEGGIDLTDVDEMMIIWKKIFDYVDEERTVWLLLSDLLA
ncbi:hypothetical protein M0802_004350 [Mischocyttarus mexicanus]|nr:hypothetical protein M0802_004350 [Mischocyttarus mexicanus]